MDERTTLALDASIDHWASNVHKAMAGRLDLYDIGGSNCALCTLFAGRMNGGHYGADICDGCPLKENGFGCQMKHNSPWKYVAEAIRTATFDGDHTPEVIQAAVALHTILVDIRERG